MQWPQRVKAHRPIKCSYCSAQKSPKARTHRKMNGEGTIMIMHMAERMANSFSTQRWRHSEVNSTACRTLTTSAWRHWRKNWPRVFSSGASSCLNFTNSSSPSNSNSNPNTNTNSRNNVAVNSSTTFLCARTALFWAKKLAICASSRGFSQHARIWRVLGQQQQRHQQNSQCLAGALARRSSSCI